MLTRDQVFLNDYVQFGFMNHIVGAVAFYNSGREADATATAVRSLAEQIKTQDAEQMVACLRDGSRVQRVAVGRLYAELAATLEDFGAFCFAVRWRTSGGIFKRYLRSQSSDVANFFDYALLHPNADLGELLNLPSLPSLQAQLDPNFHMVVDHDYAMLSTEVQLVAQGYRKVGVMSQDGILQNGLPSDWLDYTNIILEIIDGSDTTPKGGILVQAYNKLKHRFTVVEDLEALSNVTAGERHAIRYARYSVSPEPVEQLLASIVNVVRGQMELAALLGKLDSQGIQL
jgi:hypothetical protein